MTDRTVMLPLAPDEEQAIRDRLAALPWPAPWTAHTFEMDCPCPSGGDCGFVHTCEEVEAPEAYPDGQCVVQITTPGLDVFAKPCAEFIAAARTDVPRLLATLDEERKNRDAWERAVVAQAQAAERIRIVAWMRSEYPQNRHAQEWAEAIERNEDAVRE